MPEISTADVNLGELPVSAALTGGSNSGIIHWVIGFSLAGTLLAAVIYMLHNIISKRKT